MNYCNRRAKQHGFLPCHRRVRHDGPCAHDISEEFASIHNISKLTSRRESLKRAWRKGMEDGANGPAWVQALAWALLIGITALCALCIVYLLRHREAFQ